MQNNKEEILDYIKNHPDSKVKIAITDIDGILRGKVIRKDKFYNVLEGGFGFCDVVFGWDCSDISYDNGLFTGWHSGYPDAHAVVDLDTFRKIPWENDLPFFLADFESEDGQSNYVCPRKLLRKIRKESMDMGYKPIFAQEFEWFNFEETPDSFAAKGHRDPKPMTPGMFGYSLLRSSLKHPFFNDLFELLEKFNVPLEGLHTETGPGVYEAAILYGDILESADRAVLFKSAVKEIAYKHGVMASFMAKWSMDMPGCSGHVHQSLWGEESNNFFYDENDEYGMSDIMKSYVAGQLYCLPHILPMVAPNINSFKRLVEGAWAPTTLTWASDNRTTALRVLCGGNKSARLETRVCGSDTNPYLAMAACLASGLYGIKHQLKLEQSATKGNGYKDFSNGTLPASLDEATNNMKVSSVARELFGEDFVDHYTRTREWELKQFYQAVTDWEFKRYFEII
jgi:glutamine synthetase